MKHLAQCLSVFHVESLVVMPSFKIENRIRSTEVGDLQEDDFLSDELSLKCPKEMHWAIPRRQVWARDREGLMCYCRIQDPGSATELGTPL